jgi:Holliday junction resolvase-like predicted endonuclease
MGETAASGVPHPILSGELYMNDTNKKGDHAELLASAWLLEQGYEVFRNVSSTGPIDIVAIKPGEILQIDVKTCTARIDHGVKTLGAGMLNKSAKEYDVKRLFVYAGRVSWSMMELEEFL